MHACLFTYFNFYLGYDSRVQESFLIKMKSLSLEWKAFNSILIVLQLTSISNNLTEGLITVPYLTAVTSEVSRHPDLLKYLLSDSGCQMSFGTSFYPFLVLNLLLERCVGASLIKKERIGWILSCRKILCHTFRVI